MSVTEGDVSTYLLTSLTELLNHLLANGYLPTALWPFSAVHNSMHYTKDKVMET